MVLIKDIDKPQGCGGCEIPHDMCDEWARRNWGAPEPDYCPLISLDDVIARLKTKRHETTPTIESICYNRGIDDCIEILRGFPTVDDLQEGEE